MAKKLTLAILVASVLTGLVLLFFKNIDMERFYTFVKAVAYLYTPLIASIGINSGIEKFKEEKECAEKNQKLD